MILGHGVLLAKMLLAFFSDAFLCRCFTEIPATEPFFSHLKPGHIDASSDVPTTFEFLRLARNQGAKVIGCTCLARSRDQLCSWAIR